MKRYRVIQFDFDTGAFILSEEIQEWWEEGVKEHHRENKKKTIKWLLQFFGEFHSDMKIKNYIDLGVKPLSVLTFHNKFFEQIRISFIMGGYYPALVGVCALGERILNHLILALREDYKITPEYKEIYRKNQFDDWQLLIRVLESWNVLLPEVEKKFKELQKIRHNAIHFRPEIERNDRQLSLSAIKTLSDIISGQFSVFSAQPWIFFVPGESYIRKEWETNPFIKKIYIPNCAYLGPYHTVESIMPQWLIKDNYRYKDTDISDDEFIRLRVQFNENGQKIIETS